VFRFGSGVCCANAEQRNIELSTELGHEQRSENIEE